MIHRESKYTDQVDSWKNHPDESARIAKELVPDLSAEAEEMIRSHMWPLAGSPPRSNESILLCTADKYASMEDWKSWLTKHKYAARIKEQLVAEHKNPGRMKGDCRRESGYDQKDGKNLGASRCE